ncbi:hypothetical protein K432DRAFT_149190 [Lepidopterella palustris CBS 459.81]|uniref:Uncharacterized protein n=1 Tax=Lepidopterella palustris CBS 459.81 TaxID=1314670 RepID=A0A8E2E2R6_9PEZI|nr:hypothetical protein K432DRAFT_149190 [Lepidopterella palustris CBS 459.81]
MESDFCVLMIIISRASPHSGWAVYYPAVLGQEGKSYDPPGAEAKPSLPISLHGVSSQAAGGNNDGRVDKRLQSLMDRAFEITCLFLPAQLPQ